MGRKRLILLGLVTSMALSGCTTAELEAFNAGLAEAFPTPQSYSEKGMYYASPTNGTPYCTSYVPQCERPTYFDPAQNMCVGVVLPQYSNGGHGGGGGHKGGGKGGHKGGRD